MKLTKLGQMEMIGLVFIVFLMAIGMLFLVSTTNKENKDSKILNPQNIELAQNTIDAIKYLKLDCPLPYDKKIRIDDLIRDIVTDDNIYCRLQNINTPPSEIDVTSKEYVNKTISNILNATLGAWSKPYYFTITKNKGANNENQSLIITGGNCTKGKAGSEGSQPFPLRGGAETVTITLFICN